MDTLINDFTQALIPIVITLLTGLVALLLNQAREYVERRVGQEKARMIEDVLAQAVKAAQQFSASATGKERKAYAIAQAQLALDQLKIKVDVALLAGWIEAALYDVKVEEKQDAAYVARTAKITPVVPSAISYSVGTTATGTGSEHTE